MASSSKRRQTFAKMSRERAVLEKRTRKQEKSAARKLAATEEATAAENPEAAEADEEQAEA